MAILFGIATLLSTFFGGLFALRNRSSLHLILGFSAGAVIGVAFFDLLPEAISLTGRSVGATTPSAIVACGFLLFMLLNRAILLHPHHPDHEENCENASHRGRLGAGSLSLHSFLDGLGIGVAFQVSARVGLVVGAAVLAHDFSDGINTVTVIMRDCPSERPAVRWL
ncbi:MAG TPA: hypothetical protein VGS41_18295, partial [Chthonomonadales bacterium]|nr:hypothetical protein [Chthonomonadales bacterium]